MVLGLTALWLGLSSLPGTAIGLVLGAGSVSALTLRRPLQRISIARLSIQHWHVALLAIVITFLIPWLRAAALSGAQGLGRFIGNIAGLATGRLKIVEFGGKSTVVAAR